MKKWLAFFMLLLFVSSSYALDFKANGTYRIRWFNNWNGGTDYGAKYWNFDDDNEQENGFFDQRFRLKLTADNGDGIKGVVHFEMGDTIWGDANHYGRLGAEGTDVEVLEAYIEVDKEIYAKAGVFTIATPNDAIISEEMGGIMLGKDFGNVGVNLLYSRLYDGGYNTDTAKAYDDDDDADLYGVMVPVRTDYFNVTPYFLYATVDNHGDLNGTVGNVGNLRAFNQWEPAQGTLRAGPAAGGGMLGDFYGSADAWWAGAAFDGKIASLQDLMWKFQGVYGDAEINGKDGRDDYEMSGYLFDGSLTYLMNGIKFDLYGLYTNGYDKGDYKDTDLDIMPTLAPDYMVNSTYAPFFFDGIGLGRYSVDPAGYSMVGGQVAFNSIERFKHIFDVAYIQNMIDEDMLDVVDSARYYYDNFVEVAFVTDYKVAEGTTLTMLLGYLQPDENSGTMNKDVPDDAAYAVNFMLNYAF